MQKVIDNYVDLTLPLSKKIILQKLNEVESKKNLLSNFETEQFQFYKQQFAPLNSDTTSLLSFLNLKNYCENNNENYLFYFRDYQSEFSINSKIEVTNYNGNNSVIKNNSVLGLIGGEVKFNYSNWLAVYLSATNGRNFGDREIAKFDKRVEQSFTFNDTKINFFDNTEGYIRIEKELFALQFGREKILWGTGYDNKLLLNGTSQNFDFLKFDFNYKFLNYKFLHAWLVQKPYYLMDSLFNIMKLKDSKNISICRLGFEFNDFSFGMTQAVIYANRSFEPAYLNPFLFWESGQRSLGDLDNSFLGLDFKYRLTQGLSINSTILFDDLNFGLWFKGKWNTIDNRMAFQIGLDLTYPLLFKNTFLSINYVQIRPYTFTHPGFSESLSFTNNGFPLGIDIEPNSYLITINIDYNLFYNSILTFNYGYYIHGANILDSKNNLVKNVGGSYFISTRLQDSREVSLLEGNLEITNFYLVQLNYQYSYNIMFIVKYYLQNLKTDIQSLSKNFIMASINFGFNN